MQRAQMQQLAQQLKRPVMSLSEFSSLSDSELAWLNQHIAQLCEREQQLEQSTLAQVLPVTKQKKSGR